MNKKTINNKRNALVVYFKGDANKKLLSWVEQEADKMGFATSVYVRFLIMKEQASKNAQ
jgi:hypothetical protein